MMVGQILALAALPLLLHVLRREHAAYQARYRKGLDR